MSGEGMNESAVKKKSVHLVICHLISFAYESLRCQRFVNGCQRVISILWSGIYSQVAYINYMAYGGQKWWRIRVPVNTGFTRQHQVGLLNANGYLESSNLSLAGTSYGITCCQRIKSIRQSRVFSIRPRIVKNGGG